MATDAMRRSCSDGKLDMGARAALCSRWCGYAFARHRYRCFYRMAVFDLAMENARVVAERGGPGEGKRGRR